MKPGLIGSIVDDGPLVLPDDAVVQGFAILARRRSGKSTLAGVMEETFCQRRDPWVCIDPVSAHWGIRYRDDDGKPKGPSGYEVMLVGGKQGDIPLQEHAGAELARVLVDTDISCVIDLGGTSLSARQKFVADFANELFMINETPRHIFLEEAHQFVPQQLEWDNQKLVRGALERLITGGGGRGIGFTLITQRPASVSKNVLEQIDNLFALRLVGPRDLKAVEDWFQHNVGDKEQMREILNALPAFKPGEAWLLSPDWMHQVVRLQVRQRETYHAGRTPKRGEKPVNPKRIALGAVVEKFREAAGRRQLAVQEQKDLKVENADLKRQLAAKGRAAPVPTAAPSLEGIERAVNAALKGRDAAYAQERKQVGLMAGQVSKAVDVLASAVSGVQGAAERLRESLNGSMPPEMPNARSQQRRVVSQQKQVVSDRTERHAPELSRPVSPPPRYEPDATALSEMSGTLSGPQQRILNTLAELEAIGVEQPDKSVVAVFAGVSPTSGGYFNNLGRLRSGGLIEYPTGGVVRLTDEGRTVAAPSEEPATLTQLHERWLRQVSGAQAAILSDLIGLYPDTIDKNELAERIGVSPTSGGYFNNLGRLRSLGAIDYPAPGRVVATALLFPEALA